MNSLDFSRKIADIAISLYNEYKVLPSVTVAQAALESAWGESGLTKYANALFGIKAGSSWTGRTYNAATHEVINGQTVATRDNFRAYSSWYDSVKDHADFLQLPRYAAVLSATHYAAACDALQAAGYATDPQYSAKLQQIIRQHALYEYDAACVARETPAAADNVKNVEILCNPGETVNIKIVCTS